MDPKTSKRTIRITAGGGVAAVAVALTAAAVAGPAHASAAMAHRPALRTTVFASSGSSAGPDDLTTLDGKVFVAFQNGVGSQGEAAPNGATDSTVFEYSRIGKRLASWHLTGKIDGMTADRARHRIVATVNEDGHSSLDTITVRGATSTIRHFTYTPSPLPHGGGTDSIAVVDGQLIVTASAPTADPATGSYDGPALYRVSLDGSTATATPIFADNAPATDAVTGQPTRLNLSDPDSSLVMPAAAPRFAGDLLLDSQGDSQLVFLAHPDTTRQTATVLNLPTQVDDTAVATSRHGTLLVTDAGTNQVKAVSGTFTPGEVIVAIPNDSSAMAASLATLDLTSGKLTPFGGTFANPKGLLFLPDRG